MLLLNDAHEVLEHIPSTRVRNYRSGQVPQDVWAVCLDGLQVLLRKEQVDDIAAAIAVEGCFRSADRHWLL